MPSGLQLFRFSKTATTFFTLPSEKEFCLRKNKHKLLKGILHFTVGLKVVRFNFAILLRIWATGSVCSNFTAVVNLLSSTNLTFRFRFLNTRDTVTASTTKCANLRETETSFVEKNFCGSENSKTLC